MTPKKILIILISLLILVIGILVIYNFFFKETTRPEVELEEEITEEVLKPWPAAKIKVISQEPVLSPIIDGQKIKYYSAANGQIFQINFDGSDLTRISSLILQGLLKVLWSPEQTKAITILSENGKVKKYLYDYRTKQSTLLNPHIQWIAWSPAGHQIAYQYENPATGDNNISLAQPDGSNWQNIFKTRMKNLIVQWPGFNQISIQTPPSGLAQSVLYTINPETGHFQKVFSDIYGLTILWSPQGDKILFSQTNEQGRNLRLKIADKNGRIVQALDWQTLPEKCVWSQDNRTIFCALPRAIPSRAVWPDDYYKGLVTTADDFWKINLETNQKKLLIKRGQMAEDYDARQLFLSPQEDYLFFVNKKDGLLYSLKLE